VITETKVSEKYQAIFDKVRTRDWLGRIREEGFSRFMETGFPTTHDEDWRFTNVAAIANTDFDSAKPAKITPSQLEQFNTSQFACRLVFVNGYFSPDLSSIPGQKGLQVFSLGSGINEDVVEDCLAKHLDSQRDAFAALNTALFEDGICVEVERGVQVEVPIYALFVSVPATTPTMSHPRNLIVTGESSQVTVVEDYVALGEGATFSNTATELIVGENAHVSHYMIVREAADAFNVSTLRIQQGRSSNVATHSLLLSGALVRNNVHPVLAGEGAECLINGLFMANGRQHMDNYMLVEHASPHCNSRQFYNGVLNGQGHGVFHGRIIVHKDAQKTDAKQTNRNLLLSDDAQIDTKPQLEIYADDVKCTHGATIGQVEENALFYLRSRGLDEPAAKHLLLLAFANECLDRMNSEQVRNHLERLVTEWLPETARYAGDRPADVERNWEEVG